MEGTMNVMKSLQRSRVYYLDYIEALVILNSLVLSITIGWDLVGRWRDTDFLKAVGQCSHQLWFWLWAELPQSMHWPREAVGSVSVETIPSLHSEQSTSCDAEWKLQVPIFNLLECLNAEEGNKMTIRVTFPGWEVLNSSSASQRVGL